MANDQIGYWVWEQATRAILLTLGTPWPIDLYGKFGEMPRIHDEVDPGDFAALDRQQECCPNFSVIAANTGGSELAFIMADKTWT